MGKKSVRTTLGMTLDKLTDIAYTAPVHKDLRLNISPLAIGS
jgi:hypothetical protein